MKLGSLVLREVVGRGGAGVVWRATHPADAVDVAVKLLRVADEHRFLREVRVLAALRHPHVVAVHDWGRVPDDLAGIDGVTPGAAWLAMEFLAGGTLTDAAPALDGRAVLDLLRTVLSALAHAHARGVLHRDVKPANVLLDADGRWRLTDFGIASSRELGPGHGGTPAYVAPETLAGRHARPGPWTDLFSLGVMAWELTTGALPFENLEDRALGGRSRRAPFEPRLRVPTGFEGWLARMLAPSPEARFRRAAEASHALDALGPPTDGPAPGSSSAVAPRASSTPTFDFDGGTGAVEETADTEGDDLEPRGVPLPPEWDDPPEPTEPPAGLGLGLLALRPIPLVGRWPEREAAWRVLREVTGSGQAQVLWLRGPAGSGRWTFARALAERVEELGVGTGVTLAGDLRELPERVFVAERGDPLERLLGRAPHLVERWRKAASAPPADLEAGVAGAIAQQLATRGPVVLAARATAAVRRLAEELIDLPELGPVLLVVPIGADEDRPETGVTIELAPPSVAERAWLASRLLPLSREAAWSVAEAMPATADLPRHLLDLAAVGTLVPGPSGYTLTATPSGPPPAAIARLWEGASDDDREALRAAAEIGEEVDEASWAEVAAALGIVLAPDLVDRGLRSGVASATPDGFRFAPGIRAALLGDPLPPERAERVADVLLRRGRPGAGEVLARAGLLDRALPVVRTEREAAWRQLRHDEATRLAARELELLKQLGREREATDVEGWLAYFALGSGRAAEARSRAAAVGALAAARGWTEVLASSHHIQGLAVGTQGDRAGLEEHLSLAQTLSEAIGQAGFAAQIRLVRLTTNHPAEAVDALPTFDRAFFKPGELELQASLAAAALGWRERTLALAAAALAATDPRQPISIELVGLAYLACDELDPAEDILRRALAGLVDDRDFAGVLTTLSMALLDVRRGHFVDARSRLSRARRLGRRIRVAQDAARLLDVPVEAHHLDRLAFDAALAAAPAAMGRLSGARVRAVLPAFEEAARAWEAEGDELRAAALRSLVAVAQGDLDRQGYVP